LRRENSILNHSFWVAGKIGCGLESGSQVGVAAAMTEEDRSAAGLIDIGEECSEMNVWSLVANRQLNGPDSN